MSKISIITVIFILMTISAHNPVAAADEYIYKVSNDISLLNRVNGAIKYGDGELISDPGAPKIGFRIVKLALPQGKSIIGYSIETPDPILFGTASLDYIVGDLKTGNYPADTAFMADPEIYNSNRIYPENRVEILNKGNWGGINLVDLAVFPVGYRPFSGEILFYPEITVKFQLEQSTINPRLRLRSDRVAYRAIDGMVLNKEDLSLTAGMPPLSGTPKITSGIPDPEYLIITSSTIAPGFQSFVEWKNQKGLPTNIVFIEDILASTPGSDPAEQLRNYLIEAHNNGVYWVLLGGDEDVVPIRYLYDGNVNGNAPGLEFQHISDMYFSDLTGDWDLDGDGVWGEYLDDAPDLYPEIYVGRVPARDPQQAELWGSKAIAYEKNPGNGDPSYLLKALVTCADQMRDYDQNYELADMMPDYFICDVNRLQEMPDGASATPTGPEGEDVINIMNEGWGFISSLNHGSPEWYSSRSCYYNNYGWSGVWGTVVPEWNHCGGLVQLTTVDQPAVHYTTGCDLGAFDFDKGILSPNPYATTYTFAESYLFEPGGGVAFLGYTRWGWVISSFYMEESFLEHIFDDSTSRISEAEALSKIDHPNYRDLCYGHNLFGDPEMRMWIHLDGNLEVEGPEQVDPGSIVDLIYTVRENNNPVSGARVCAYIPGEIFQLATTDENGEAVFTLSSGYEGIMTVTATRQNYIPAQMQVIVGTPSGIEDDEVIVPNTASIHQNYPNPFNDYTMIEFELPGAAFVDLDVYDVAGRHVKNLASRQYSPGIYRIPWDGTNKADDGVASGIYIFRFSAGNTVDIKQMTLIK